VFLPFGVHTFTLLVTDGLGGSATDTVVVTIADTTAPTFTFVPPNMSVTTATPLIPPATATDNCGGPVTITNNAPPIFALGTTTVTWTARDASNNSSVATTDVTFGILSLTLTPPTASYAPGASHTVTATVGASGGVGIPGAPVTFTVMSGPNAGVTGSSVSDIAGVASFTYSSNGNVGIDQIRANSGATLSNFVTATWNRPPISNAGPDQLLQCPGAVSLNGTASTDPDTGDVLTYTWTSPSIVGSLTGATVNVPLAAGVHTFTLEVKDSLGVIATDTVVVTIADTTAPVFTFVPPNMTVNTPTPLIPPATATDNCGAVTITNDAPASFPLGSTTVTWTAKDASNNVTTATTVVTYTTQQQEHADKLPPTCKFTASIPGPPQRYELTVQDTGTGLKSIIVTTATNLMVNVPQFAPGTTSPVIVIVTVIDPKVIPGMILRITDMAGNSMDCHSH
jgi:hypothetical protein